MKKIYIFAAILILSVIFAEILARSVGFGSPLLYRKSISGYEISPDQDIVRLGKQTNINSLGVRGQEVKIEPDKDVFRILVLGDSVSNGGTLVNDEDTWPVKLQNKLNENGKYFEVINASAGGWSIINEAEWLNDHGLFGSKLLILQINERDLDQAFVGSEILDSNISFPTKNPSTALGELTTRYILPRLGLGGSGADPGSIGAAFQPENTKSVMEAVEKIRSITDANNAVLVILYWDLREPAPADYISARERLFDYALNNKIMIVRPNLNENKDGAHFFRDEIHPNKKGNSEISNVMGNYLKKCFKNDQFLMNPICPLDNNPK